MICLIVLKYLLFATILAIVSEVLEYCLKGTWIYKNGDRYYLGILFGVIIAIGVHEIK